MLDLSWGEIVLIGAAAVIFIGPKELPGALRTMGKFMGKARTMAREFQNNVDDMIREAELQEIQKKVQSATSIASGGIAGAIQSAIDPKGELQKAIAAPDALSAPVVSEPAAPAPAQTTAAAAPTPETPSAPKTT
jgi:sec-independent protein translocase protein TatB